MPATRTPRRDIVLRVPRAIPSNGRPAAAANAIASGSLLYGGQGEHGSSTAASAMASLYDRGTREAWHSGTSGRRSASPVKGGPSRTTPHPAGLVASSSGDGTSEKEYRFAAESTSAAEWNSLLIWARRQRGPQWDSGTGMWQVDERSTAYYSFGNDPARHTKLSRASKRPAELKSGHGAGEEVPGMPSTSGSSSAASIPGAPYISAPGMAAEPGSAESLNVSSATSSVTQTASAHPAAAPSSLFAPGIASDAGNGPQGSMTPLADQDSPPPSGPGIRRSRAR